MPIASSRRGISSSCCWGRSSQGSWVLVRTRGGPRQWLLIKHRDETPWRRRSDHREAPARSCPDGRWPRSAAPPGRARASSSWPPPPTPPRRPRALWHAGRSRRRARCRTRYPDRAAAGEARPPPARAYGAERVPAGLHPPPPAGSARPVSWCERRRPAEHTWSGPRPVHCAAHRHGYRGDPRRRARHPAHQSPQGLLARARPHEARPPPVLRGRGAGPPAASPRPGHGDEALPERGGAAVLLHEAGAPAASAVFDLCPIEHESGNVIDFPVVQDLLSLLWVVNLGCIDLNQWYARCDDVDRPDYVHFDLDPVTGATTVPFERLREAALTVRDALRRARHAGLRQDHRLPRLPRVRVIVRGPTQKEVSDLREAGRPGARGRPPGPPDRGVPDRPAPGGADPSRLQPERMGTDPGVHLLGPALSARARCRRPSPGPRSRGGSGWRTSTSGTFPRRCGRVATFGRRSSPTRSGCAFRQYPEPRGRRVG